MLRQTSAEDEAARLKVGVIGLGYWGPNLLRVLSDRRDLELAWICDLQDDRLEAMARRYPTARPTAEHRDLFDDETLDAVLLATPVGTHHELALASLEAGKHTFVEKPLAATAEQADELLRIAGDRDRVLMCGHTFLYSPPVRAVKEIIDRGELGEIYFVTSSRVNLGLHQSDISVLWDLGPHDFSILRYWLDELPESISTMARASIVEGIPDVAFVTASYPSGTMANLEMSWLAPSKLRRTVVVGSEKMVVYEDGASEPVRVFDHGVVYKDPDTFGEYQLSYRTGDIVSPHVDTSEPLAIEIEDFIRSAAESTPPNGHGELCRDVVRMIEAAEASLEGGGAPVRLDDSVAVGAAN